MKRSDILYWCKRHRALLILAVIAVLWVAFELKDCDPIKFWLRRVLSDQDLLDEMNAQLRKDFTSLEEWYHFAAYNLLARASGCVFALQFLLPLLSGLLIALRFSTREAELRRSLGQLFVHLPSCRLGVAPHVANHTVFVPVTPYIQFSSISEESWKSVLHLSPLSVPLRRVF
jgi:hypothetical protein